MAPVASDTHDPDAAQPPREQLAASLAAIADADAASPTPGDPTPASTYRHILQYQQQAIDALKGDTSREVVGLLLDVAGLEAARNTPQEPPTRLQDGAIALADAHRAALDAGSDGEIQLTAGMAAAEEVLASRHTPTDIDVAAAVELSLLARLREQAASTEGASDA